MLTPTADDIWLNAMANIKGTEKYKVRCGILLPIQIKNNARLCQDNVDGNMNNVQFKAIVDDYADKHIFPF